MSRDEENYFAGRYVTVVALITIAGLLLLSGLLTWLGASVLIAHPPWDTLLLGLATSLVASVIVYLLLSLFVEPKQLSLIIRQASTYAVDYSQDRFREVFADSVPAATFRQSESLGRSFRDSFAKHLAPSGDYFFKGSDGSFTAFRLGVLRSRMSGKTIRLCLVNPRDDRAVKGYAYLDLTRRGETPSAVKMQAQSDELRLDIFATLMALFELRAEIRTEVYFHNDLPHYRSEILGDALFLTYYDGESRFPEILQFSHDSRLYRTYRHAFETACKYSSGVLIFADDRPQSDVIRDTGAFEQSLTSLGYTNGLDKLRSVLVAREGRYHKELDAAGLTEADLF